MYISIGSASNIADWMEPKSIAQSLEWQSDHPLGESWGSETNRAAILETDPEGHEPIQVFATGIRNGATIAIRPGSGDLWVATNERDFLGDDLVPDYLTRVRKGGFYGWPWYYIGGNPDSRLNGKHPELKSKTIVPDVLLQSHSASLQMTFYDGKQFPAEYRGDVFASQHGSWNRQVRSGYEVVRVPLNHGKSNGVYEDFLTGFLTSNGDVWGRPVGVATAQDGSLLVSDDGSGSVWRVSYTGK